MACSCKHYGSFSPSYGAMELTTTHKLLVAAALAAVLWSFKPARR